MLRLKVFWMQYLHFSFSPDLLYDDVYYVCWTSYARRLHLCWGIDVSPRVSIELVNCNYCYLEYFELACFDILSLPCRPS